MWMSSENTPRPGPPGRRVPLVVGGALVALLIVPSGGCAEKVEPIPAPTSSVAPPPPPPDTVKLKGGNSIDRPRSIKERVGGAPDS